VLDRLDDLQRRHTVLGFPHAVWRKYLDDRGAREAALITYYGFLSLFPVLLLAVTVVSWVLAQRPDLRQRLIVAIVPPSLQSTVADAAAALPTSSLALVIGVIGLVLSGSGVVSSAYQTVNHLAAVPYRSRAWFIARYLRVIGALLITMTGAVMVGGCTVVAAYLPDLPWVTRLASALGSGLVAFAVLLLVGRTLLIRAVPVRALCPAAAPGAIAVALLLQLGAAVLPGLVRRAGPVYGGFATVAGIFSLLYLLSVVLVYAGEIAAVRAARLWPRALVRTRPTAADVHALVLLAREQAREPAQRIEVHLPRPPDPPPRRSA
jgi:membrane protein